MIGLPAELDRVCDETAEQNRERSVMYLLLLMSLVSVFHLDTSLIHSRSHSTQNINIMSGETYTIFKNRDQILEEPKKIG